MANVILSPYEYIINNKSKGKFLKNSIIIWDEAHNIINTAADHYSGCISYDNIVLSKEKIKKKMDKIMGVGVKFKALKNFSLMFTYMEKVCSKNTGFFKGE